MDIREGQEWSCLKSGEIYSIDWCVGDTIGYSNGGVDVPSKYFDNNPKYQEFSEQYKVSFVDSDFDPSYSYKYIGRPLFDEDGDYLEVPSKKLWINNCKSMRDTEFVKNFTFVKETQWWREEHGEDFIKVGQIWEWRFWHDQPWADMTTQERFDNAIRIFRVTSIGRDLRDDPKKRSPRVIRAIALFDKTNTYVRGKYKAEIFMNRNDFGHADTGFRLIADVDEVIENGF